ncbi:hypothetical protein [Bdellovibrio sp. HCB288]|uniref:hypothetical protein n=1 Tax=Bdellovibrio sp. HCB288 TaxID=3394355 RepID=UPI0039B6785F
MMNPLVKMILILGLTISTLTACEEQAAEPSTGGSANKAVLSSWATANSAWAIRLDLSGANITGSQFTMTVKFSDTSEIHCDATMNGTESTGSYTVSNCVAPGTSSMADSVGGSTFHTNGAGSYVNNGSSFYWCRANNACFTYY